MVVLKKIRRLTIVGMLSLGLSLAPQVQATTYTDLVVFGDSLSDSGNIFDLFGGLFGPSAPYTDGRFTSPYTNGDPGLVWVEHLAGMMGLSLDNSLSLAGGSNYAFGGARATEVGSDLVPSLPDQMGFYLADTMGVAAASALFVVFGGGNDVRANDIGGAVAGMSSVISGLAAAGAVNFFVPTLPDIGLTPESQAGEAPGSVDPAVISQAAADYNAGLLAEVAALELSLGVNIITFDIFGLFNDILGDPGAFGLSNVTDACAGIELDVACTDPDSFLFFDGVHPTAIVHQMMGEIAFQQIQKVPVPAALPLLLSALGLLGWGSRKTA